ncbi:unnamed protein product [Phytophthora fragariaefolia]|uniref:Unnamed protein product n=1 Tax=Phytophthora fragariaefolia TaxID=1490495 RepID=A0A9W6U0R9_9STRA|nr:unnamed protein product [Phytophthora fragariaefolia]
MRLGSEPCYTDWCVYKRGARSDLTVVGEYVDELFITGTRVPNVDKFFEDMMVLNVKDLGHVSSFWARGESSGKAEHIDVRVKFVKNFEQKSAIKVKYCESHKMRADGQGIASTTIERAAGADQRRTSQEGMLDDEWVHQ